MADFVEGDVVYCREFGIGVVCAVVVGSFSPLKCRFGLGIQHYSMDGAHITGNEAARIAHYEPVEREREQKRKDGMNKLIYLASPYTHDDPSIVASRVAAAQQVTAELIVRENAIVYSPIAHSHDIADFLPEDKRFDHDFWIKQCFAILERCNELCVLCLDGWKESRGVTAEIDFAAQRNIPIKYLEASDYSFHKSVTQRTELALGWCCELLETLDECPETVLLHTKCPREALGCDRCVDKSPTECWKKYLMEHRVY